MKIPNIKGLFNVSKAVVVAHRPELLFGASIVSTLAAVGLAGKAGYESGQQVLKAENPSIDWDNNVPENKLDAKEKLRLTWLNYLPAAGATIGALGSTTALHIVHVNEKKAIAAAALMAIDEVRNEANDYVEQVKEIVTGEGKPSEKVKEIESISAGSDGEVAEKYLVRDPITGRDIWANKAQIEEAIIEVGNCLNASSECSLNNFWGWAGWGRLSLGDELGWCGVIPSIDWNDQFGRPISGVRDDGRPWRGFRFVPEPEKGYEDAPNG